MLAKFKLLRLIYLLIAAAILVGAINLLRPLPTLSASPAKLNQPSAAVVTLPWPAAGQAAFGTQTGGLLAASGDQKPVPIASIAKVIAALAVLNQKPLAVGQQGPTITLDATDVGYFNYYYSNDGSVAQVADGEQITEYQALQAMMLPSANNMADSLTRWAFGSASAYVDYANQMVKDMGLQNTTVDGASGFADQSLSTATDLLTLAQAALNNPVLADIVSQAQANIPQAGTINNVNWLLGSDGVVGIKTGNTDAAGGCFMFAAKRVIQGQNITVIGAVVGDTDLNKALSDSRALIEAGDANFQLVSVKAGQVFGTYTAPWGASTKAVAQKTTSLLAWKDKAVTIKPSLKNIKSSSAAGTNAGSVKITAGTKSASSPLLTQTAIQKPPISWRLFRF